MRSGVILVFVQGTKNLALYNMGVFNSKHPDFSMKTDEQLWYEISENLTELSRRDKVNYRVRASKESVIEKLKALGLTSEISIKTKEKN